MLKKITLLLLLTAAGLFSQAQTITVFAHSGYTFGDKFPISGGRGKIYDGHTYGGLLGIQLTDQYVLEVSYSRQDTRVLAISPYLTMNVDEPISVSYIMGGINRQLMLSEQAAVFGGLKFGAGLFNSKKDAFENVTRFAVGLNVGGAYYFTEQLGLRIQANLNAPVTDIGANLWWSPGSGIDVGVSSYTPVLQFGFTGGLVVRLNQ